MAIDKIYNIKTKKIAGDKTYYNEVGKVYYPDNGFPYMELYMFPGIKYGLYEADKFNR